MTTRSFKVLYLNTSNVKLGRICSCASIEGVIRTAAVRVFTGAADSAFVEVHGEVVAVIDRNDAGQVSLYTEY